jgi:FkbM family methyltransferase
MPHFEVEMESSRTRARAIRAFDACLFAATIAIASASASCGQTPPAAESRRNILGTEKNRYSQHGEELVIRDFFQDRTGGVFLDVGCAWPVEFSNTYFLERELGWTGIGVDGLPDYEPRWRKRRPKSRFLNFIVTDHSGTIESFYRPVSRDLLGISSSSEKNPAHPKVEYEQIRVPTITLDALLEQNGVSKIDLLSMDIEGGEPLALAGFDIERFRPELAVVEVHGATRDPVVAYFRAHGYDRMEKYSEFDPVNYYFSRASAP